MAEPTLDQLLLAFERRRRANEFVGLEYLDEYWSLVAFTDGFFMARGHRPDAGWDAFVRWLTDIGLIEGSEGWRLAIPRRAAQDARPPAALFFELLERFDRERRAR